MKIRDLIRRLIEYNMDADVNIVVHCMPEEFTICCGGSEGGSEGSAKLTCDEVSLYVDRLCKSETKSE